MSCAACGADLKGRRPHARHCDAKCRREAYRIRRLEAGIPDGPYRTLAEYRGRRRNRRANRSEKA